MVDTNITNEQIVELMNRVNQNPTRVLSFTHSSEDVPAEESYFITFMGEHYSVSHRTYLLLQSFDEVRDKSIIVPDTQANINSPIQAQVADTTTPVPQEYHNLTPNELNEVLASMYNNSLQSHEISATSEEVSSSSLTISDNGILNAINSDNSASAESADNSTLSENERAFNALMNSEDINITSNQEESSTPLVSESNNPEAEEHSPIDDDITERETPEEASEVVPEEEQKEENTKEEEEIKDTIPPNSETLLIDSETSRFSSALWFDKIKEQTVVLAGIGGIGSHVGFLLSRLHIKQLILFDDDKVEAENMAGQLYSMEDINNYKVNSLANTICKYSNFFSIVTNNNKFGTSSYTDKVMICGFDNMAARKTFFDAWNNHRQLASLEEQKEYLFIDGRLAAEELQVLCIRGDDMYNIDKYEKEFLFTDEEADATNCSYKQTSFCATLIGSIITNLFVNFVANQCNPIIERDLPFLTEYRADRMFFKTIE